MADVMRGAFRTLNDLSGVFQDIAYVSKDAIQDTADATDMPFTTPAAGPGAQRPARKAGPTRSHPGKR
jgi:hypothetical protein